METGEIETLAKEEEMGKKELEKRVAFLEEYLIGMSQEGAREFLKEYDQTCKKLQGPELESHITTNSRAVELAQKLAGA